MDHVDHFRFFIDEHQKISEHLVDIDLSTDGQYVLCCNEEGGAGRYRYIFAVSEVISIFSSDPFKKNHFLYILKIYTLARCIPAKHTV